MNLAELKQSVRDRLAAFERLERRNTDQAGWISLTLGVTRRRAAKLIAEAQNEVRP